MTWRDSAAGRRDSRCRAARASVSRLGRRLEGLEHALPVLRELLRLLGGLVAVLLEGHGRRAGVAVSTERVGDRVVVLGPVLLAHERAVVRHREAPGRVGLEHLSLVL